MLPILDGWAGPGAWAGLAKGGVAGKLLVKTGFNWTLVIITACLLLVLLPEILVLDHFSALSLHPSSFFLDDGVDGVEVVDWRWSYSCLRSFHCRLVFFLHRYWTSLGSLWNSKSLLSLSLVSLGLCLVVFLVLSQPPRISLGVPDWVLFENKIIHWTKIYFQSNLQKTLPVIAHKFSKKYNQSYIMMKSVWSRLQI